MQSGWYDRTTRRARDLSCGDTRVFVEFEVRRIECRDCGKVKREQLDFLSDNPFYTKRFGLVVGRRCRAASIQDVAKEFHLDWHTVKELDKQYMQVQLDRASKPAPKVIGVDEISIRKGHTYRIVVSDLVRARPIWFGGEDRSESMQQFFEALGKRNSARIRLAVMDRWKPFRHATNTAAPQAAILFDTFHISRRENLSSDGRQSLKTLLSANQRLNTAYLLKESFGQWWSYEREGWARRFFENWKDALKWQRLKPYEKFAEMIDRHWNGIAAYCKSENKVSPGFVEGLNNTIRVIQRRAYGLRDEEYLNFKILTCMLPTL